MISTKQTLGQNFSTGFAMLKDRVIKPLLVATEKVVEYYFPEEEKKEIPSIKETADIKMSEPIEKSNPKEFIATRPGTVADDQTSISSSFESELVKVKKRFSKLTMHGASTNSLTQTLLESEALKSPRSVSGHSSGEKNNCFTGLKKRRYRHLERFDIFDTTNYSDGSRQGLVANGSKSDKRSIKLNQKMLKKASATIDLISQKVKTQNII